MLAGPTIPRSEEGQTLKVRREKGQDGKEVVMFTPETEEDLELLRAMEERGKLDARATPNDEPEPPKKGR